MKEDEPVSRLTELLRQARKADEQLGKGLEADSEPQQPGSKAPHCNPSRATKEALAIAYQDGVGDLKAMRPDFLFFIDSDQGVQANIVDPHGSWLPDALAKLRGMARFAEAYDDRFHRIESISRIDGKLRVLDFTLPEVRATVLEAIDADNAYRQSSVAY